MEQMKAMVFFMTGFLLAASARGEGTIRFANTTNTLLMTNSCGRVQTIGRMGEEYYVGLYWAPFGVKNESLFTMIFRTNISSPGLFGGTITFPWMIPDLPCSFQIKAWQKDGGGSYEAAVASICNCYYGKSAIGFVTPSTAIETAPSLMGDNCGQVSGFTVLYLGGAPPFYINGTNEFGCPYIPPPPPVPPPPVLTDVAMNITHSMGGGHTISWTNTATAYLLEWTSTLSGSNYWQAIAANVENTNGLFQYSSTNSSARFYRLRKFCGP